MAQVITKVSAYGIEADEPLTKRFVQRLAIDYTGAASDAALDIGNTAGTFWTAVSGTTAGAAALAAYKAIVAKMKQFNRIESSQLFSRLRVASSPATNQYTATITSGGPSITFEAASAPTAATYVLEFELPDGVSPVRASA